MTPAGPIKARLAGSWPLLLVFLLPLALFTAAILPATRFNDIDGFYHYKVAQLIGRGHPWVDIHWLPYTVLGQNGPDHHWLYHVLIAPFTWIGDDILGLKLVIIATASLIAPVLYGLLRGWRVPGAWLFALLALFGGLLVPWRFEMLRTQGVAVMLACAFTYCLVRRRHVATLLLTWVFFNTYYGAAITAPILLCFLAWSWFTGTPALRALGVYLAAVALALVLNPWFPGNVEYLLFHTIYNTLHNTVDKMPDHLWDMVGTEWLPYPLKDFLLDNALLHGLELILLLLSLQDLLQKKVRLRQLSAETVIFVAMSALLFGATLSSRRFIEYYAPFSALASGLLLRDLLASREAQAPDGLSFLLRGKGQLLAGGAAMLLLLAGMGRNLLLTPSQQIYDVSPYQPLARYLEEHVRKGSLIFNTAWSDFPQLFWYTTDYDMANGLDSRYLAYGDPQRFALWFKVTQLHQFDTPDMARTIAESFHTRWILVHRADHDLAQYLADSGQASLRFSYEYGWLFEVAGP
jgi:hypothetical protein